MAFKRKGAPSAKSLDFPYVKGDGVNSAVQLDNDCYATGNSPVNSKGQVTDRQGTIMNWPYQRSTIDNELNPRSNQAKPTSLSESPQAFGDFLQADGTPGNLNPNVRQTLG